jgi:hypothetical protein
MMRRPTHPARLAGFVTCMAVLLCPSAAPAQAPAYPPPFPDAGTFRFYLNEEVLVTSDFTWDEQGTYAGEYTLRMAGQSVTTSISLPLTAEGDWSQIRMETAQGTVKVVRDDSLAVVTHKEQTATLQLRPGTVLFENFSPALMALAVRHYNAAAGGKQTFPIFIIPQVVMDGSLERLDIVERMISGADVSLTRYLYGLPGVDVTLYVDAQGKVVFGDVPSQHGAYVREGFEALLASAAIDSSLSQPQYDVVVESNVGAPMRDGLSLATDIYRPQAEGRFPIVLVRTPYKKEMLEVQGRFFARRGYVYAAQDCRGRFSSPGVWDPFFNEAEDGYDAIEWLAVQPWASGRVGMIGASYVGWVQWWAARNRPPHLTTIIPNVSPPDPHYNIPYEYGCFFLTGAIWWADVLESNATGDLSGKAMAEINEKEYTRLLRKLPVVDLDEHILGKQNRYWREWIAHPDNDAYWERANFLDYLTDLDIPVFHQSGWFDGDGIGSKLNYLRMTSLGHRAQKLVLGPWGHTDTATRSASVTLEKRRSSICNATTCAGSIIG